MAHITLITGGARSGKSSYAQQLAENRSRHPVYLATARVWDEDFSQRITRHQAERGPNWENLEEEKQLSRFNLDGRFVLLDCITLWLTNFFYDNNNDVDKTLEEAKAEWDRFIKFDGGLIVVTNELGMGVHPENELARKFADLQGWMNQYIARQANRVILMVSGIPVQIK
jgi:adenosylcobinamide kinase/adenosylcobinamide-phosphate guanylyltransferase